MNRQLIRIVTSATILLLAWLFWQETPRLVGWLGLGRFDLLVRVLLLFGALGLLERGIAWILARSPHLSHIIRDDQHDH